jgi:hypothetical protein
MKSKEKEDFLKVLQNLNFPTLENLTDSIFTLKIEVSGTEFSISGKIVNYDLNVRKKFDGRAITFEAETNISSLSTRMRAIRPKSSLDNSLWNEGNKPFILTFYSTSEKTLSLAWRLDCNMGDSRSAGGRSLVIEKVTKGQVVFR